MDTLLLQVKVRGADRMCVVVISVKHVEQLNGRDGSRAREVALGILVSERSFVGE